jgi:molybdopterin converting factor small subunit
VKVAIRLLGSLRTITGESLTRLEVIEGSNLEAVLYELGAKYPPLLDFIKKVPRTSLILINGVEAGNLQGNKTIVEADTNITILPVVHGG